VFRPTAVTGRFLVAAASGQETTAFGLNTFRTRIPVQAGDRFGLIPVGEADFYCLTGSNDDHTWSYSGTDVQVGSEYQFAAGVQVRVPVVAVIEPDVDGDGYGDETQDACPQSANTIAPCPPVTSTFTMRPKKKSIIAKVRVSSPASVQVFGGVSWQVRGRPKTSARNHTLTVLISAGEARPMAAGETKQLDDFVVTTAFVMRVFIFILLGSQVDFTLIREHWAGGVMVVLVLMFVARPLTVYACALPDRRARWTAREMLFMCWTRETGVIPGALAGILLGMHAPGAPVIASVTFIAILMTILIQATTTRWVARKLGLLI